MTVKELIAMLGQLKPEQQIIFIMPPAEVFPKTREINYAKGRGIGFQQCVVAAGEYYVATIDCERRNHDMWYY